MKLSNLFLVLILSACLSAPIFGAGYVTGEISMFGQFVPQNKTGTSQSDLNGATQVSYSRSYVLAVTGSFAAIPTLTRLTIANPFVYRPFFSFGNHWTVTSAWGEVFKFIPVSLSRSPVAGIMGNQSFTLSGIGVVYIEGSTRYKPTLCYWSETFYAYSLSPFVRFNWTWEGKVTGAPLQPAK